MNFIQTEDRVRQATRPTWAEVSLSALCQNFRLLQRHVGADVAVCAVVKADGYGHGGRHCALALEAAGATWFGVTSTDEGVMLREAGIRGRILLMTGFWRGEEEEVIRQDLTPAVWEVWHVDELNRAASRTGPSPVRVHLKVDSGMSRLGVTLDKLDALCKKLKEYRALSLEGVFTHFAASEVLDGDESEVQANRFEKALRIVEATGLQPSLYHMANSSAIIGRPQSWKNMVRPGLALYGYTLPLQRDGRTADAGIPLDLKPVLSWKSRILSVKEVGAGERLGYNGTYTAPVPSRIAVIPVGYADGLSRQLSSRGRVIVRSQYAPIVGLISMDLTLIDVTAIPGIQVGDEVILLGSSGSLSVTAWDQARLASTVPYEILCGISKRVPRKYSA